MPLYASDAIFIMNRYLGYCEKDDNATLYDDNAIGSHNFTKFAYEIDRDHSMFYDSKCNGKPWSSLFIHYCFIKAFGESETLKILYLRPRNQAYDVRYMLNVYKSHNKFGTEAKLGSQMFLARDDGEMLETTGIVTKVNSDGVVAIIADANDTIMQVRYQFEKSNIIGYGYPDYSDPTADAIKIHFTPPLPNWGNLEEIRHNELDITAAGSISQSSGEDGQSSMQYNASAGPVVVLVKQKTLSNEDSMGATLSEMSNLLKEIVSDPIAYDKKLHPSLYTPPSSGSDDGGDGAQEEIKTLQTPLITLLTNGADSYMSQLGYSLDSSSSDGTDEEKQITYIEWLKYSSSDGSYIIIILPAFTYNLKLSDGEDDFWDVWIFNKPALGSLIAATRLYDRYENMQLNVRDFHGASGVTELQVANSNLYGDIEGFSDCSSLTTLYAGYSNITGELKVFSGTSIETLSVFSTNIKCNISQLGALTTVQHFNVNTTAVYGDLSGVSGMTQLRKFDLSNTDVTGNLSALSGLMNLEEIWLHEDIIGDLSALAPLTHLKRIYLKNMEGITGNIKALAGLHELSSLTITRCPIYGDIKSIANCPLTILDLQGCNVSGDLGALNSLSGIKILHLAEMPNLSGSINDLFKMKVIKPPVVDEEGHSTSPILIGGLKNIQALTISECPNVKGTIDAISDLSSLIQFCLSNVVVTGKVDDMHGLPNLEYLELHEVSVGGTFDSLTQFHNLSTVIMRITKNTGNLETIKFMPSLKNLCLYDNKITGDVASFNDSNIVHAKINRTRIYGNLKSIVNKDMEMMIIFGDRIMGNEKEMVNANISYHGTRQQEWL